MCQVHFQLETFRFNGIHGFPEEHRSTKDVVACQAYGTCTVKAAHVLTPPSAKITEGTLHTHRIQTDQQTMALLFSKSISSKIPKFSSTRTFFWRLIGVT